MNDDIILKDKLLIYDNQAHSGKSEGRLSVTYEFHPAPVVFWEFETFGESNSVPEYNQDAKLLYPFEGYKLTIPEARFGETISTNLPVRSFGTHTGGSAAKVLVGDQTILGKSFSFILPNAMFQKVGFEGRHFIVKEISYHVPESKDKFPVSLVDRFQEGYLIAKFDKDIKLTIYTPIEAIEWLRSRSTGTYITTSGTLDFSDETTISDALRLLQVMTDMLSFANGGYIAPLVVSMTPQAHGTDYPSQYTAYEIDPVERLGGTWLDSESDAAIILECLPSFQKMLQTPQWERNYYSILMWYLQAIQPQGIQIRGKPWPIVANALGAALEKLASIILVEEMKVFTDQQFNNRKMTLEKKIRQLLNIIGVSVIPKYGDPEYGSRDAIWWFSELRNDATHPRSKHNWDEEGVNVIGGNAIQWVEETLLWRIGYQGKYRDRSKGENFSTSPRYNLASRDPSW